MKHKILILGLVFLMIACNLFSSRIDGGKVNIDNNTKLYTYKENNQKVTGTVFFYELDPKSTKKYKVSLREVKEGKRINKGYDYFPSGAIMTEYPYDLNGLITGSVKNYFENGQLHYLIDYQDDNEHGVSKEYREDGTQVKEIVYSAGTIVKEYDFDNSGKKILPAIEKLELISFETGFFEYNNLNSYQLLYQPMVIMKWKNISDEPISEKIELEAIFIDNSDNEEWSKASDYFQGYSETPLQPGLSRQSSLQSNVGYTSAFGIYNADISCQILINKQIFQTIKINNKILNSNRIQ